MTLSEFMFTIATLNVSIAGFVWIIKQIIQLCHWVYKHEMERINDNE